MHLVQILLPMQDDKGKPFPSSLYENIRKQLTEAFGGLTTYMRAPAKGLWKDDEHKTEKDDIVIFEVMLSELDESWWRNYKQSLEKQFAQDEIVIRVLAMELIGKGRH